MIYSYSITIGTILTISYNYYCKNSTFYPCGGGGTVISVTQKRLYNVIVDIILRYKVFSGIAIMTKISVPVYA